MMSKRSNLSTSIRYAHANPQIKILPGISVTGNGRLDFSGCFALDPTIRLLNKPIFDKSPQLDISFPNSTIMRWWTTRSMAAAMVMGSLKI